MFDNDVCEAEMFEMVRNMEDDFICDTVLFDENDEVKSYFVQNIKYKKYPAYIYSCLGDLAFTNYGGTLQNRIPKAIEFYKKNSCTRNVISHFQYVTVIWVTSLPL